MNLYLRMLKAKDGDNKAMEDIIKTYEIFINIQMRKYGIRDIESCYSEVIWKIYQCVMSYRAITFENKKQAA